VVTRISIDVLRSARVRREEYVGQWFPEPLLTDPYEDPERSAELAEGNARNSPSASSTPSGKATSTGYGSCSPPTRR